MSFEGREGQPRLLSLEEVAKLNGEKRSQLIIRAMAALEAELKKRNCEVVFNINPTERYTYSSGSYPTEGGLRSALAEAFRAGDPTAIQDFAKSNDDIPANDDMWKYMDTYEAVNFALRAAEVDFQV